MLYHQRRVSLKRLVPGTLCLPSECWSLPRQACQAEEGAPASPRATVTRRCPSAGPATRVRFAVLTGGVTWDPLRPARQGQCSPLGLLLP